VTRHDDDEQWLGWRGEGPWFVDEAFMGPVQPRWRILAGSCAVELDGRWFRECGKPDCERVVPEGVMFCCPACAVAAERRFEVDRHAESCDTLWAERERTLTERYGG
jgi:hypothetical protein